MIEQKNNNLYLRDLTARTKSSGYSVAALSAMRFAVESQFGSVLPVEDRPQNGAHIWLGWSILKRRRRKNRNLEYSRRSPQKYHVAPYVWTSLLTNRPHRLVCADFQSPRGAAPLNLHFICFRSGCPSFLARAAAYTHAQHARDRPNSPVGSISRKISLERTVARITRSDGCAERMNAGATTSIRTSSIFNEVDACWRAVKNLLAKYMGHRNLRISHEAW